MFIQSNEQTIPRVYENNACAHSVYLALSPPLKGPAQVV